MPRTWEGYTPEQIAEATEEARRNSRFKFAKARIRAIANGAPRLTAEQFAELRELLPAPSGGCDDS